MQKPGEYSCERFDKLQAGLLKEDPATTAFYNAQLRTGRRVSTAIWFNTKTGRRVSTAIWFNTKTGRRVSTAIVV